MRKWKMCRLLARVIDRPMTMPCRSAQASNFKILFSSNDSKLDCLRESSVSFCAPTGIDPVGAGQYPKVRCRRKRPPTPEGESDAESQHQRTEYVRRGGQRYVTDLAHP